MEFRVERFEDVTLTDNGVLPWLKRQTVPSLAASKQAVEVSRGSGTGPASTVKSTPAAAIADEGILALKLKESVDGGML